MTAAEKITDTAKKYVGYLEKKSNRQLENFTANAGSENYTMFAATYKKLTGADLQAQPWCAMFISCVANEALGTAAAKTALGGSFFASCTVGISKLKKASKWTGTPKAGDLVFFSDKSGKPAHVGIVSAVGNGKIYTIEGNTSAAAGVVPNGGAVAEKSYSVTYNRILGYGRLDGLVGTQSITAKCPYTEPTFLLRSGSSGVGVKWLQWHLVRAGFRISVDGIVGARTVSALKVFQENAGLAADGICGQKTRVALKKADSA